MNFEKVLFIFVLMGLFMSPTQAADPIYKPNDRIVPTLADQPGPITTETVEAYWQKRVTDLTINQITAEQCPEVEVIVSLLDDQGNPISGLTNTDFVLREDGQQLPINVRPITSGAGSEISLAICIDISGSLSSSDLANEKDAAIQLVNLLGSNDSVAIYVFGSGVQLVQNFTSDKAIAIAAITSIRGGGSTSLYDGVFQALTNTSQQSGRKAVVVMTDGADNSSSNNAQDVIDLATSSNIPVFSIGFGNANGTVLENMSNQTGGIFFPSANSQDLLLILDRIGIILGQQYILSYRSPSPDGAVHQIRVETIIGGETIADVRDYSGCLFEPVPDAPVFINDNNFFIDADGYLVCIFPDPNSDGSNPDGLANFSYRVFLLVNCQIVVGPILVSQTDATDTWPKVVTLDPQEVPNQPFIIRVARTFEGQTNSEPPAIDIQSPPTTTSTLPTNVRNYQRWLLHVPRLAGGFGGLLRLNNTSPLASEVSLAGFDVLGNLLKIEQLMVPERDTVYRELYGSGLFGEFEDQISHIGIFETNPLTQVWLQYQNTSSKYTSWVQEISLADGLATGTILELESRNDMRYTDGVVVLNLSTSQRTQPWAVQRNRTSGNFIREFQLGAIPPGGKQSIILSDMFPLEANSVYSLETRDPRQTIQALGLSFFGSNFFAPIPVIRP